MTTTIAQVESAVHRGPARLFGSRGAGSLGTVHNGWGRSKSPFCGRVVRGPRDPDWSWGLCPCLFSVRLSGDVFAICIALAIFSPSPKILQFRNITGVVWVYTIVGGMLILL
jgi:hypothetical protein